MDSKPVDPKLETQPPQEPDMMSKVFDMIKAKIDADNNKPPPKKKRVRKYTPAQRKTMLANLKKGREAKLAKNRRKKEEKLKVKTETVKKAVVVEPKKVEKIEPKPEPKQEQVAPNPVPVPTPQIPVKPLPRVVIDFSRGGRLFF
jgi:hypothetical protein